jgi:SSS family solute:Na+ symporter
MVLSLFLAQAAAPYSLAPLDLAVIAFYFVLVAAVGWWVYKKTKTGEDLFLAGRSLTWGVVGFSLFASNISSTSLIGLAGTAYDTGIVVANYEWMAAIILVVMCFTTIPIFLRSGIETIPEYLERRFNARCRRYFSALNIFLILFVDTAGGLYAGALVMKLFFPGLEVWQLCWIIALLAGAYTASGGLRAVALTDVMQAIILLIGSCVMTYYVLAEIDFDWFGALRQLPADHLSLIRPIDDPFLPWTGTLIGVPLIGFYFWSTNQFITQRILGAKNVSHARWGALFAGFLKVIPLFIMILPGSFAILLYPDLANGDLVYPTLIVDLLPVGLVGLVVAALIAAVMSSVDSSLNSASTLVTLDFVRPRIPDLSPTATARLGRYLTGGFMIFSALWAPFIQSFPGLWAYLQSVLSYSVPPIVALYIVGFLSRRVTGRAAFRALVTSHLAAAILFVLDVRDIWSLHFTTVAGVLFALAVVLLLTLSPAPGKDDAAQPAADSPLLFRGAMATDSAEATSGWWRNYKILSVALIVFTSVVVIAFW